LILHSGKAFAGREEGGGGAGVVGQKGENASPSPIDAALSWTRNVSLAMKKQRRCLKTPPQRVKRRDRVPIR